MDNTIAKCIRKVSRKIHVVPTYAVLLITVELKPKG